VQRAHQRGDHRDIKPTNILVTEQVPEPWVIDFGIAKAVEEKTPSPRRR
jgi:serine/threonine protein kinase